MQQREEMIKGKNCVVWKRTLNGRQAAVAALAVTAVVASTKPHKQVNYIQFNYVAAVANASISNEAEHMKNILKQNDASRRGNGGNGNRCVHIK